MDPNVTHVEWDGSFGSRQLCEPPSLSAGRCSPAGTAETFHQRRPQQAIAPEAQNAWWLHAYEYVFCIMDSHTQTSRNPCLRGGQHFHDSTPGQIGSKVKGQTPTCRSSAVTRKEWSCLVSWCKRLQSTAGVVLHQPRFLLPGFRRG